MVHSLQEMLGRQAVTFKHIYLSAQFLTQGKVFEPCLANLQHVIICSLVATKELQNLYRNRISEYRIFFGIG